MLNTKHVYLSVTKLTIVISITVLFILPIVVQAARMFCRSDPIVFLSDGTRLQFNASVQTSRENLVSIHYQLHVPDGVTIDRIVFTPGWASEIETVELINDQSAGNYRIITIVNTGNEAVDIEIDAMKVSRQNGGQGSSHQTATGLSGQPIIVYFNG